MNYQQILTAVNEIFFTADNQRADELLDQLETALPNGDVNDLIFHSFKGYTPEQVVEEALKRQAGHESRQ